MICSISFTELAALAFVVGLWVQEAMEAYRQGASIYFSKWWNVVDTLIVLTFPLAYIVWFTARIQFKQWKPRETAFIAADAIYSTASVLAYFHLAHIFQVNSVLGPLQLSLYRMLKDVLKFLAIFFLLYIAFATGVINTYSYYVVSQKQLKKDGDPDQYPAVPRYGKYVYHPMSSN